MRIEIIGTESLGVRGLCTVVTTADRVILIDPGLALGFRRLGRMPHPLQVHLGDRVRRSIVAATAKATDIVFSHYHGDHVPLVGANPYQLDADSFAEACRNPRFWCKSPDHPVDRISRRYHDLQRALGRSLPIAEGDRAGGLSFSDPQPHGAAGSGLGAVMMTRIAEGDEVFVHASDIQLLEEDPVSQILLWRPATVLVSGPPLYLSRLTPGQVEGALRNARRLAEEVETLIIDHHLLRSREGFGWLDALAAKPGNRILCAADYMGSRRLPLEAWRDRLYRDMPVPEGWHQAYAAGRIDLGESAPERDRDR